MASRSIVLKVALVLVTSFLAFLPRGFCFERPMDFRGLKWGTDIKKIKGLVPDATVGVPTSEVKYYIRQSDSLEIAGGNVNSIHYGFVQDRLTKVAIRFKGDEQFRKMESLFKKLYGPPDDTKKTNSPKRTILQCFWYASTDDQANLTLISEHFYFSQKQTHEVMRAVMEWKGFVKDKSGL